MNCRQARDSCEELFDGETSPQHIPGLEEHLDACPECRDWRALECRIVNALEQLETFPVPADFTVRVLGRLPDTVPEPRSGLAVQTEVILDRAQEVWGSLLDGLTRPGGRRRLVPVLASVAALILVFGLLYALAGNEVSATPGAATGNTAWAIGGGAIVVAAVLLVALVLWLRKR
jgi:anti-sigma factor (TIGR02949 family)